MMPPKLCATKIIGRLLVWLDISPRHLGSQDLVHHVPLSTPYGGTDSPLKSSRGQRDLGRSGVHHDPSSVFAPRADRAGEGRAAS